jgi:hypothetical protein
LKAKSATYSDKRRRARSIRRLKVGDIIVAKQKRTNKWMTRFGSAEYIVEAIKGTMVTVIDHKGWRLTLERSSFKALVRQIQYGR